MNHKFISFKSQTHKQPHTATHKRPQMQHILEEVETMTTKAYANNILCII